MPTAAALCIAVGSVACGSNATSESAAMSLTWDVNATAVGDDVLALELLIRNSGETAFAFERFEPYLDFDIVAAEGSDADLALGRVDMPVRPRSETLEPGATLRLATPIRLRFGLPAEAPRPREVLVRSVGERPRLALVARVGGVACPAAAIPVTF
jgi:hypothetical protein